MHTRVMRNSILKNKNALCVFICMVIPLLCEITVFQYSHYRSLGCEEQIIAADLDISGFTEYDTPAFAADREVRNICISGVSLSGTDEIKLRAELSDEGDKYLYPLSDTEIEAGSAAAVKDCINIYPYGKVHEIYAHFTIPEGAEVRVDKISINAKVPMDIKPLRCLVLFLITLFLAASFVLGDSLPVCSRTSKLQQVCILLFILTVLALGWGLSRSNTKLYSGAYAHHAQYQELARALKDGHCDLFFYPADGRLKTAENPYDTSSLQVEGIEYLPDYAYFDGKYYVYFGILPELLLYLPWHLATGRDLANANAAFVFYALFVISFFALIWEAVHRYGNGRLPFHL